MPNVKDRFGDKVKTNVLTNEIQEIKTWIKNKQVKEGKYYEYIERDHRITTLHRKGQWINPNRISILNKPKVRHEFDLEWSNREQLPPIEQQKVQLERLMANPEQELRFRTQKHAEKDMHLYTPRVFRNEGGNLMSSIAGAGCNKFHEFRQIRRNDRDREKFFDYLRDKETRERIVAAHFKACREANERKLKRNRKKRARETTNHNKNNKRRMALKVAQANKNRIKNEVFIAKRRRASGQQDGQEQDDVVIIDEIRNTNEIIDLDGESGSESESLEKDDDKPGPSTAPVEEEYDPDDSYDEDEDEGLPPLELRQKFAGLKK